MIAVTATEPTSLKIEEIVGGGASGAHEAVVVGGVVVNATSTPVIKASLFEEDADSRDSGISMASCTSTIGATDSTDFSKVVELTRHALTDCSNFVAKVYNSSSSRSSSFYHCDTPTGRKLKSVFYEGEEDLDQSQYSLADRLDKHRKRSSTSMSPICSLMDRKRSRNLSLAAPQSDKICRYNGGIMKQHDDPFGSDEDDDDVFVRPQKEFAAPTFVAPIPPRSAASLWDLGRANGLNESSDNSANGSFHEKHHSKHPIRAMSVGVIDQDASLPSMLEVKYSLPSVERPQKASQAYRSISAITLLAEFQRLGAAFDETYVVIDCRYPYEFLGGHVKGAINLYKRGEIKAKFFPEDVGGVLQIGVQEKRIPIFYCEYSQKRGPTMANAVRSIDRVRNELHYPHVEYPEMYLLDHGYKSLWNRRECRQICEPCDYVPMDHKHFTTQLKTARLERHRSNASVKPNGEPELESKRSMRTRSMSRRNSSVLSFQSKFSQSSSTLSNTSEMLASRFSARSDDMFFLDGAADFEGPPPKKSVSAFDIHSIGSEVDLDFEMIRRRPSALSVASVAEEHVVQLGLKIDSPAFPGRPSELTPSATSSQYFPMGQGTLNTPRQCLDFSAVSDTE